MNIANKVCLALIALYVGAVMLLGVASMLAGIRDSDTGVLNPYGGRAGMYLEDMRE